MGIRSSPSQIQLNFVILATVLHHTKLVVVAYSKANALVTFLSLQLGKGGPDRVIRRLPDATGAWACRSWGVISTCRQELENETNGQVAELLTESMACIACQPISITTLL